MIRPLEEFLIYVDPSRCLGCKSCELACAVEHSSSKLLYASIFEEPGPKPRTSVVVTDSIYVPLRCMHCDPAPCVEACPTGSMRRTDEGFVISDPSRCIGCRTCLLACPFGHPSYSSRGKVIKCDHCIDRFRMGLPPACVEACPTGALRFGRAEDLLAEERRKRALELIVGLGEGGVVYRGIAIGSPERR